MRGAESTRAIRQRLKVDSTESSIGRTIQMEAQECSIVVDPTTRFSAWAAAEMALLLQPCRGDASLLLPRVGKPSRARYPSLVCLSASHPPSSTTTTTTPVTQSGATVATTTTTTIAGSASPVVKKRKRYRKAYPGETQGIAEEMRFVAMRLRNDEIKGQNSAEIAEGETWKPSAQGFVKYLVDSRLVFETLERTVDQSEDVAYAYFRKTGLERANSASRDLDWFGELGFEIPSPSSSATTYAAYLTELAETSQPSFLCHFYNVYFAHATGGLKIGQQVSEKLDLCRELEIYKWDDDVFVLLQGTREKLNKLGEHWSRDEKNKCLREAAKCFRYLGQIVRLIIL